MANMHDKTTKSIPSFYKFLILRKLTVCKKRILAKRKMITSANIFPISFCIIKRALGHQKKFKISNIQPNLKRERI